MTIIAFTGTPGSGKTYDSIVKLLDNLAMGRKVYTNIRGINEPLCLECIKSVVGLSDLAMQKQLSFIDDEEVWEFWEHVENGCLIILDEVQNFFGSREWMSEKNKSFGKWASTHRHYGFDLLLITQHIERLDITIRSLVEWTYVYKKVNFFGSLVKNSYICFSYSGYELRGDPIAKKVKQYDKKIFQCYQSYAFKDIQEQGIMKHANVLRHPVFLALPLILVFTIYMIFFKSSFSDGDVFGSKKIVKQAVKNTEKITIKETNVTENKNKLTTKNKNHLITLSNRDD